MGVRNFMKYLEEIGYFELIKSIEKEILIEESKPWFLKSKKWLDFLEKLYIERLKFVGKYIEEEKISKKCWHRINCGSIIIYKCF